MALTNFPNGLSSFGFPLLGCGPVLSTGAVWFVNSATGVDAAGRGTSPSVPFASIDFAVGQCTASSGAIIFAMPGHAETISAAGSLTLDVAGISIIGLGNGSNRPTITWGTVVTASIVASAANVTIQNVVMDMTGLDAITTAIVVSGAYFSVVGCKIIAAVTASQATNVFTLASGADYFSISYTEIDGNVAGPASCFNSTAAVAGFKCLNCNIYGNWSTGLFVSSSTFHWTNMYIDSNRLTQSNGTAKAIFVFTTSSTGIVSNNTLKGTTWASAADAITGGTNADLNWLQNFGFDVGGAASGVLVPAVGTIS